MHASRRSSTRVTDAEIAEVLARWTGIPVARMLEGEREKLLRITSYNVCYTKLLRAT